MVKESEEQIELYTAEEFYQEAQNEYIELDQNI